MIQPLILAALPAILGIIAKGAAIVGGVAAGYTAYQQLTSQGAPAPVNVPMLPQETSRRQLARAYYGPQAGGTAQRITDLVAVPDPQGGTTYVSRGEARAMGYAPRFGGRRMNVLNPRALSRSIRRVKGFSKFAMRVGSYTAPGRHYKLKGFKRRARR